MTDRVHRVTDLFVEGTEVPCGLDQEGSPVLLWLKKLNAFEVEEARRDAMAGRADRLLQLKDPTNPEFTNFASQLDDWSHDELVQHRVEQLTEEILARAGDDIEADAGWREDLDYLRRMPAILADALVPEDDERRTRLAEVSQRYRDEMGVRMEKIREERRAELAEMTTEDLKNEFLQEWRLRESVNQFMQEKRVTELFYATRECSATMKPEGGWDHGACGHQRWLSSKAEVRELPDGLLRELIARFDDMVMGVRAAGNSDALASSSASSEQPSAEAESTASTPAATQPGAPMT